MALRSVIEVFEAEFRRAKLYVEASVGQLDEGELHVRINPWQNSVASIIQHMAGNMVSRFTDFLTSDGEKPERDREGEFVDRELGRVELMGLWDRGWALAFGAIEPLMDADLGRVVIIRREPYTVAAALARQVGHYSWHAGQVALIGKHLKGEAWRYLTIEPGKSEEFNRKTGV